MEQLNSIELLTLFMDLAKDTSNLRTVEKIRCVQELAKRIDANPVNIFFDNIKAFIK